MLVRSTRLSRVPGVVHGFTTRTGGVSEGELAELNLGWRDHERPEHLQENWNRVASELGVGVQTITVVEQVHGASVVAGDDGLGPLVPIGDADALTCVTPGRGVAVRVADCVPILMAGPGGVAAVHAGWRGTAQAIVVEAVKALVTALECEPGALVAAIGPRIGPCCYAVGEEVVQGIGAHLPETEFSQRRGGEIYVDLASANAGLLRSCGVVEIDVMEACTRCEERFFSHRGSGPRTGRMAAIVWWEGV